MQQHCDTKHVWRRLLALAESSSNEHDCIRQEHRHYNKHIKKRFNGSTLICCVATDVAPAAQGPFRVTACARTIMFFTHLRCPKECLQCRAGKADLLRAYGVPEAERMHEDNPGSSFAAEAAVRPGSIHASAITSFVEPKGRTPTTPWCTHEFQDTRVHAVATGGLFEALANSAVSIQVLTRDASRELQAEVAAAASQPAYRGHQPEHIRFPPFTFSK